MRTILAILDGLLLKIAAWLDAWDEESSDNPERYREIERDDH